MKNTLILKNRMTNLLNKMDGGVGEEYVDAGGDETSETDYNFDILRQHYAGTDFESEANSLCDVVSSFSVKNKGVGGLIPIIHGIHDMVSGKELPGLEPYEDFISKIMEMLEESVINKADVALPPELETARELPNVKSAQAKMIELEQYLQGVGLSERQKWKDYLAEARQKAAVGDDDFNPTPEFAPDDMEYMRESSRQKTTRDSAKNSILQGLVGVNPPEGM